MIKANTDATRIQRGLLTGFLILVSVALVYFGMTLGFPVIGLMIPAIAIISALFSRPAALLMLILFVSNAKLRFPGLPSALSLSVICLALMAGWSMLDVAIKHQKRPFSFSAGTDRWMIVFSLNILLLMAVRGTGFARLGGTVYGGAVYVALLTGLLFYFAAIRIRLSSREVKILLWAGLIGALIPAVAAFLVHRAGGHFEWLNQFVDDLTETTQDRAVSMDEGLQRWSSFRPLSLALIPVAFILCRKETARWMVLILALLLVSLTGFRTEIIKLGLLIFFTSIYFSKKRAKTFVIFVLIGLIGFVVLIVTAPALPPAIQRAVSFLPFVPVDPDVVQETLNSSNFRFDMWHDYCLPNVPKYLLLGRGLAHDIVGFSWLQKSWYSSGEFFYYMGVYHSGPFDLLLTYGLAGTVAFTVFFLLTLVDGWRTVRRYAAHQNTLAAGYFVFLTIRLTYEIFAFYFVFGDIKTQLFQFLLIAAQMRIIKKNFLMGESGAEKLEDGAPTLQLTAGSVGPVNGWARHRIGARGGSLPAAGR